MKAIMIMFDSLNLRHLPSYGNKKLDLPNFDRLSKKAVQFENNYVGSMPCIPARRELHTGRYNFLHRSWGPIEPFDESIFEKMDTKGIYTHLITDHQHYWEDGGCTYHTRYSSCELIRGQEGDKWKALLGVKPNDSEFSTPLDHSPVMKKLHAHDAVNRQYTNTEETMPQTITFNNGLEFLNKNHTQDNWFLQIESFDPHEPFFAAQKYRDRYVADNSEKLSDWPPYYFVSESKTVIEKTKNNYAALLAQCDSNLGKILDFMDDHSMWEDTMLIVNTDHGYLLGEHGWWSKTIMPMYNEISHVPLFIHYPGVNVEGEKRYTLTQNVDIPATILDYFDLAPLPYMQGQSLKPVIKNDTPVREYALFGDHGKHVNITNGQLVYMRAPENIENAPLFEYTLMPTHMRNMFSTTELENAELVKNQFDFMKNAPCLKIPVTTKVTPFFNYGTKLFDVKKDPNQKKALDDEILEIKMINALIEEMKKNESPEEQFHRLGIPTSPIVTARWLKESKMKREEPPQILTSYSWTEEAKNVYNTFQHLANPNCDQKKKIIDAILNRLVTDQIEVEYVLKSIMDIIPVENKAITQYFLEMAGRKE
ncbi:sulfatase [Vagococcus elongatus]|uniref:Sulfatase N-terminal domain-containing protein n=1 Tax=Vagococcus elongatus TaxID=180344 RepID=A0A430B4B1_9ENTE|nr:sulfatase [Vagococcus elongatus]RSU15177.1 hypothetical protein CBF29_02255 [Vagococcus elongatus]